MGAGVTFQLTRGAELLDREQSDPRTGQFEATLTVEQVSESAALLTRAAARQALTDTGKQGSKVVADPEKLTQEQRLSLVADEIIEEYARLLSSGGRVLSTSNGVLRKESRRVVATLASAGEPTFVERRMANETKGQKYAVDQFPAVAVGYDFVQGGVSRKGSALFADVRGTYWYLAVDGNSKFASFGQFWTGVKLLDKVGELKPCDLKIVETTDCKVPKEYYNRFLALRPTRAVAIDAQAWKATDDPLLLLSYGAEGETTGRLSLMRRNAEGASLERDADSQKNNLATPETVLMEVTVPDGSGAKTYGFKYPTKLDEREAALRSIVFRLGDLFVTLADVTTRFEASELDSTKDKRIKLPIEALAYNTMTYAR